MSLKSICEEPGCHALIDLRAGINRCPAHLEAYKAREQQRRRKPRDRSKDTHEKWRGSARARGYDTTWDRYARSYLVQHPYCAMCSKPHRPKLAELVDHIIPVEVAPERFRDPDNHQSLCRSCHAAKSAEDRIRYARPIRNDAEDKL